MKDYKTVKTNASGEFTEEKSRFIGYSFMVETKQQAEEYINLIRKKHYDATHNCFAYILGEDMDTMKQSDDGEPSGTAGIPMLEVLKKENITNCLVIATRYFGGIKLGAGGLIRAYTKTAKVAIDSNEIVDKKVYKKIRVVLDYSFVGKMQNYIQINEIISKPPEFLQNVTFEVYKKDEDVERFKTDIMDMTAGVCEIDIKEDVYLYFTNDVFDEKLSF